MTTLSALRRQLRLVAFNSDRAFGAYFGKSFVIAEMMYKYSNVVPKRKPSEQHFPDPAAFDNPKAIADVNEIVLESIESNSSLKRQGTYANYGDEFRSKVARYAK